MKYFLKRLGTTILYGLFSAGVFLSGIHIMDDYTKNMDRIEEEQQAEKQKQEETSK